MIFFSFDYFSIWIMINYSKDLGFEQFSFTYNFPIDQNLFLFLFDWENIKRVCVTIMLTGLWHFVMFILNYNFIHYLNIRSIHIMFLLILFVVTLDNDHTQCLMIHNSTKTFQNTSLQKFCFHTKKYMKISAKIKHGLDRYMGNIFLK